MRRAIKNISKKFIFVYDKTNILNYHAKFYLAKIPTALPHINRRGITSGETFSALYKNISFCLSPKEQKSIFEIQVLFNLYQAFEEKMCLRTFFCEQNIKNQIIWCSGHKTNFPISITFHLFDSSVNKNRK